MQNPNYCNLCNGMLFLNEMGYRQHVRSEQHMIRVIEPINSRIKKISAAFTCSVLHYKYLNEGPEVRMAVDFLNEAFEAFALHGENLLNSYASAKVNFEVFAEYILLKDGVEYADIKSFQSNMTIETMCCDLEQSFMEHGKTIISKMDEFQESDSGWQLLWIPRLEMNFNKYMPIELPHKLRYETAVVNVQNKDVFCFKWTVIAALSTKLKLRTSSYDVRIFDDFIEINDEITLNFSGLPFPLSPRDIKMFLHLNPTISITLFGYDSENENVYGLIFYTKEIKEHHINMLLVENRNKYHYTWINNLSDLFSSQTGTSRQKKWYCDICLNFKMSEQDFLKHKEMCNGKVCTLPNPLNAVVKFQNYQKSLPLPFVAYADFLEPRNSEVSLKFTMCNRNIPEAYAYYVKCEYDNGLDKFVLQTRNHGINFLRSLIDDLTNIYLRYLSKKVSPTMSSEEEEEFQQSITCHICEGALDLYRVKDHCDITGKFRGAAHKECKLKYKIEPFIPVYLHNFSKYDYKFLIKVLASSSGEVKLLPINKEKYISISKIIKVCNKRNLEIRFLDSHQFMPSSLNTLASNLDEEQLITVKTHFKCESQFKLMRRKVTLPYQNTLINLEETSLPPREAFKSLSNETDLSENSEENYTHALNIWNDFSCTTLEDYLELYLKSNVFLLVDVFEYFRKLCLRIFSLDPAHFYTIPSLSWEAMLKTTKIELDIFTNIDLHTFVQSGIRYGLVQCCHRYSLANNKYISTYDPSKESSFLMYLDANNLNDWAMSQPLPYAGFKWLLQSELQNVDVLKIPIDLEYGYIFEVDLVYPYNIHDCHNDLPFCPSNILPTQSAKVKQLIADLGDKKNYIIHYKNLQQCLSYGLQLKKIHRGVRFLQKPWLKTYINLNKSHRASAKNTFEKDFFRLLNNSVFEKTIENVEERVDVKLISEWQSHSKDDDGGQERICARYLIAKNNFHSCQILSENSCAIQMKRFNILYNKPSYLGFVLMELSRWKVYDFHYNYVKPKFGENVKLNHIDNDSIIYTIKTNDFYNDIRDDVDVKFDASYYSDEAAKKFEIKGFKDKLNGQPILEFFGLRSKMFALKIDEVDKKTV